MCMTDWNSSSKDCPENWNNILGTGWFLMVCISVCVTISSFTNGDDLQGQALSILNPTRPADPQRTRIGEPSFNVPFNKRDLPNNQTPVRWNQCSGAVLPQLWKSDKWLCEVCLIWIPWVRLGQMTKTPRAVIVVCNIFLLSITTVHPDSIPIYRTMIRV